MKQQRTIIEADIIQLKDNEGRVRILLDGGSCNGVASIALFSRDDKRTVNITSQQDNRVEISLRGCGGTSFLTLSMDSNNKSSITLSDVNGRFGIILGASPLCNDSGNQIQLFHDGQVCCTLPEAEAGSDSLK